MTKKLSEWQKAKLKEAIQLVKEAQEYVWQMNQVVDQIIEEEKSN